MKKSILLFVVCCFATWAEATTSLTVSSSAGGLSKAIATAGGTLTTVTNLTVTGTIDARDFKMMRDTMTALTIADLSGATISAYTGTDGTADITSIAYSANVVPKNAFYYCTRFSSIKISSSVTSIGDFAFYFCKGLTSFSLPLVSSIGVESFRNCTSLSSFTIPTTVTSIGEEAFRDCSGIASFTIPASVTVIGQEAISTNSLITVDANNANYSSVDNVLFNKTQTKLIQCPTVKTGSYTISSTVDSLGFHAFYECANLTSITIPSTVKYIAGLAFCDCTGLTSLSIPSSVTSIDYDAFRGCSNLTSIKAYSTTPIDLSKTYGVFNDVDTVNCILYVPAGSQSLYAAASQWKAFKNIQIVTSVFNATASNVKVTIKNGTAIISGLTQGEYLAVYNLQGVTIYSQKVTSETVSVNLPGHGVYLVKVGSESVKVVY
jgi:hypothetical protein